MSANDVVTWFLAAAAVLVSIVAAGATISANKRAARSALTDLTAKITKKAAAYANLDYESQYAAGLEIEVLVRQADALVDQLGSWVPEMIGITLARTLELVRDYWWADDYWARAATVKKPSVATRLVRQTSRWRRCRRAETNDQYFRALAMSAWGVALYDRGEPDKGREKTTQAVDGLTDKTPEASIVRGDICLTMGGRDAELADRWYARAREEYATIPDAERRAAYLAALDNSIQDAAGAAARAAEAADLALQRAEPAEASSITE